MRLPVVTVFKRTSSVLPLAHRLTSLQASQNRQGKMSTGLIGLHATAQTWRAKQECLPYLLKRKKREPRLDEAPL